MKVELKKDPNKRYICAIESLRSDEITDFVEILGRLDMGIYKSGKNSPEDILERIRHSVVFTSSIWVPKSPSRGNTPKKKLTAHEQERVSLVQWLVIRTIRGETDFPFPRLHIIAEHRMEALAKSFEPYVPTEEEKREIEISQYTDKIEKLETENRILKDLIREGGQS